MKCIKVLAIACFFMISVMPAQAEEYKIGGMYTYSYHDGRYADWGDFALQAAQMAITDINASKMLGANSITMPSELIVNYQCWPEGAAEHARSLIDKGVLAITGVDCSGPAVEIAREGGKAKIPTLSYGANAQNLTSSEEFPFFYRNVTPSTEYEGYLLDVAQFYNLNNIALFYTTDAWGIGAANVIQTDAFKADIIIKAAYGYPRGTSDAEVLKRMKEVKEQGIKTIFITMPTPDTVTAFRALTTLDMNQPGYAFFAGEMTSADEKPNAMNGAKGYIAPMTKLMPSKQLDAFYKRFSKESGVENIDPNSKAFFYAVLSYDHMMALGHAMQAALVESPKEVTGELLMKHLRTTSFEGLSGVNNLRAGTNDREIMAIEMMNFQGYAEDGKSVSFVPVGYVDPITGELKLQGDKILWPGNMRTPPKK